MVQILPELIMGVILGAFAWAFRAWASTIGDSSNRILGKLHEVSKEVHTHRLENETRLVRMETELITLFKRMDSIDLTKSEKVIHYDGEKQGK